MPRRLWRTQPRAPHPVRGSVAAVPSARRWARARAHRPDGRGYRCRAQAPPTVARSGTARASPVPGDARAPGGLPRGCTAQATARRGGRVPAPPRSAPRPPRSAAPPGDLRPLARTPRTRTRRRPAPARAPGRVAATRLQAPGFPLARRLCLLKEGVRSGRRPAIRPRARARIPTHAYEFARVPAAPCAVARRTSAAALPPRQAAWAPRPRRSAGRPSGPRPRGRQAPTTAGAASARPAAPARPARRARPAPEPEPPPCDLRSRVILARAGRTRASAAIPRLDRPPPS